MIVARDVHPVETVVVIVVHTRRRRAGTAVGGGETAEVFEIGRDIQTQAIAQAHAITLRLQLPLQHDLGLRDGEVRQAFPQPTTGCDAG